VLRESAENYAKWQTWHAEELASQREHETNQHGVMQERVDYLEKLLDETLESLLNDGSADALRQWESSRSGAAISMHCCKEEWTTCGKSLEIQRKSMVH